MLVAVLPTSVQESNFTDSSLVLDFYQVESSQEYIFVHLLSIQQRSLCILKAIFELYKIFTAGS